MRQLTLALLAVVTLMVTDASAAEKLKLLIVDGQNNHNWKSTTPVLKSFLEKSGRFTVTVATSPGRNSKDADWAKFRPNFAAADVVLSNYNGQLWPKPVQASLEKYISGGGGLVIVHAANNAFPGWGE
ncbi:MAG: ThuA domain-containing protein, partial [Planctomycetota bacterium]|nr:ThuA domain-containing protein [Planctomycetota bacterium]